MRAGLLRLADQLRQSYWFLPSLMALAAVLLAGGMVWLDSYEGSGWMDRLPWLYASRPSGARQLLSAIGGSMVTVAGTVFSVTIAAVVYASGQYGPRLLSNFMRDRGNQVTLGTFIATFLYCLIVLRTIRTPEETGGSGFVPNLAVLVALLLAVCSIAVLIFFIHHVPSRIHINSVIQDIGHRLLREVGQRFPEPLGEEPEEKPDPNDPALPEAFRRNGDGARAAVRATGTGYVQVIEDETLLRLAREHDLVCRIQYQPGDFVHAGRALLELWPPERCDDDLADSLRDTYAIGAQRTALQDLRFLVDELVEIAARALSPGVNDPFTAVTCLDWLGAALSELCGRRLPSHLREDEDGQVRVIAHPVTFETFLDRSFGALLRYASADVVASLHFLATLGEIAVDCDHPGRIAALADYAERLQQGAEETLNGFDLERVRTRAEELRRALAEPDYRRQLRNGTAWLGGTT
ncbi:DUF2254 domain-containing protein [Sphingomonas sp. ac-8]|uniref:DUF2254 domain-containing protein n=1 Tax=Sphingomonas sp. ac-8 TaxID=3242977 RepID=UPI003A8024CD